MCVVVCLPFNAFLYFYMPNILIHRPQISLTVFQRNPFLRVCSASLLKTLWEKEKLLVTSNFTFSHGVFFPFGEFSAIFIQLQIFVCKHLQFGRA